ncbi:SDR family NAD(P)-dependent oxidoreductase [Nonomuraea sp. NPDC003804]|uniref:SDR family NAD(P)-dependent oxidoreductase n=1 Tax=Nonomuraea sp. NPDC003804 TaxID=3154547 RepID=UPI0033AD01F5
MSKVWFVTGSSRGLGRDFVEAALSRGDQVAATARTTAGFNDLLAMPLGGAYHVSKWAVEALNESLAQEVADFGIKVTVIEPGGFATRSGKNPDPLDNGHMAEPNPIYDGLRRRLAGFAGKQPAGDPAAAQALLKIVDADNPPLRVLFGLGFYPMLQQVYADRLKTWADWQDLSAEAHGNLGQGE